MSDPLSDLNFGSWLSRHTDVQSAIKQSNYTNWFSDRMAQGRLQTLEFKLSSAKSQDEKMSALMEGQAAMVLYSTLIYYVYPAVPSVKREIDTKPELRENFSRLKEWFDGNGGSKIADDFYRELVSRMAERKTE